MGPLLLFLAFPLLQGGPDVPPIQMEDFEGEPGIVAKVDGKPHKFVLATRWPSSYLLGAKGAAKSIVVGAAIVAKVPLQSLPKAQMYPNADGVLGADALRQACFAIDPLYQRMEILPSPKIGIEGAKAYFAKLPAWGARVPVVRIPLGRTLEGVPTVSVSLGGQKTTLVLSFSPYNSTLGPTVEKPKTVGMEGWSYLPNLVIPGLAARWIEYGDYDKWDAAEEGAQGILALNAFVSRRVLVDLGDNAVYVEELSEAARISFFLSNHLQLPVVVSGEEARLGPLPGLYVEDAVGPMNGFKLVSVAEIPVAEWIRDLRSASAEAAARLDKRFRRLNDDFDVVVVGPDGVEQTIPISRRGQPEDTF